MLFHPPLPNVPSVSDIMPSLFKLALLYKVLLCRLVWLADFLKIQSSKGDICSKRCKILKKSNLCAFVAFFMLKYWKLANITASFCFVETWVVFEQDMTCVKSIMSNINSFAQTMWFVVFVAFTLETRLKFFIRFEICTEIKHSLF